MRNSAPASATRDRGGTTTADSGLAAPSDDELVRRVGKGDEQAFTRLLRRHLQAIHHYLFRLTGSRADSDDLAQETFLALWRKAATYRPGRVRFGTWLHRIAHNQCIDHLRRSARTAEQPLPETSEPDAGPEANRHRDEHRRRLHQALERLPANQRDAILLCHQQGLSNRDAAIVLGIGVRAVESLLARARRTLRQEFQEETAT